MIWQQICKVHFRFLRSQEKEKRFLTVTNRVSAEVPEENLVWMRSSGLLKKYEVYRLYVLNTLEERVMLKIKEQKYGL